MFSDVFGGGGGGGGRSAGPAAGRSLRAGIELTLEEVRTGAKRTLKVRRREECETCKGTGAAAGSRPTVCGGCGGAGQVLRQNGFFSLRQTCPRCKGRGKTISNPCRGCDGGGLAPKSVEIEVNVPAGLDDGVQLKLRNQGEPSTDGGPRGDFYCVISVEEHKIFTRKGRDLLVDCRISPAEAALGCEKRIPTLDGSEELVVPKGAQPGDIVKIRGKGVPEAGRPDAFGDILVKIVVDIPEEALGTRKGTLGRTPQTARRRCAEGRRGHLHEDPRVVRLRNAMPDNDTTPHDDPIPGSGTPPKADTPASDATEGGTTPEAGADGEATTDDAATAEAFAQIAELAKKAEERDRLFEQLQRLNAEFQNFRGRTAKEKADERRYAVRDVMRNLLPALDNLERALFDRRDGRPGLADRRRPA
jgi:DnaJ-class molecular chaperone